MEKGKLSVCLVVWDEDKYLPRCLESVQEVADEIIVVDAAARNNFSDARNFSLDKAKCEWVLVLDGDEELDPQSIGPLRRCIEHQERDAYLIKMLNYYEAGTVIHVAVDTVCRLFRNKEGYRYSGFSDEQICENISRANPEAKFGLAEDISILHKVYLLENLRTKDKSQRNTRLLEQAIKQDPDNLLDRFHLGVEYLRTKPPTIALEQFLYVYDRVHKQAIYVPQLMSSITTCRYLLGEFYLGLDFIEQVWSKYFPDQGDLYYLKGLICRALGRHMEAYYSFSHCLKLTYQPLHYVNLHHQHKYKMYFELGQLAEFFMDKETALQLYMEALKNNPVGLEPLAKIIGILNPKENPDYTEDCLNKFFDLTDQGVRVAIGKIFFEKGAYALAIKYFSLFQAEGTFYAQVHLLKGISHLYLKQYAMAIGELNKIPMEDNLYINAQSRLFLYYWTCNFSNRASGCLNNCRLAGVPPLLLDFLSTLSGDTKPASETTGGVEEKLPDVFIGLFELLIELDRPKKLEQAIDCLKGLVRPYPAKLLADLFYKHGKFERAKAEYKQVITHEQFDAELLFHLGKTYQALGNLTKAENYLCKAISAGDESPKNAWELARLYQQMALKALEEELEEHPESQASQEIRNMLANISTSLIEV